MSELTFKTREECFLCNGSGKCQILYLHGYLHKEYIDGEGEEPCPICEGCGNLYLPTDKLK